MKFLKTLTFRFLAFSLPFWGVALNSAQSGGMTVHMFMADVAMSKVNNAELKNFLKENRASYLNGSIYPDSGYIPGQNYGEFSHWGGFHTIYLNYIREHCTYPFEGDCAPLVGFFLGSIAHGISDYYFDHNFLTRAAAESFKGDVGLAQQIIDPGLDLVVLREEHRSRILPEDTTPHQHLANIYASGGFPAGSAEKIKKAAKLLRVALVGERAGAPAGYLYFKMKAPWAMKYYLVAKGGILDTGKKVGKYWEYIWQRLKDPNDRDYVHIRHFEDFI